MAKDSSVSGFRVKCPECGASGSVTDKSIDIECGCGKVFKYSEPKQNIMPVFDIVTEEEKPKKKKEIVPEEKTFQCSNCKEPVKKGATECLGCGYNLEWE